MKRRFACWVQRLDLANPRPAPGAEAIWEAGQWLQRSMGEIVRGFPRGALLLLQVARGAALLAVLTLPIWFPILLLLDA